MHQKEDQRPGGIEPYRSAPTLPAHEPVAFIKRSIPRATVIALSVAGASMVLLAVLLGLWGLALYGAIFAVPIVALYAVRQKTTIYATHIVQGRIFKTMFVLAETKHVFYDDSAGEAFLAVSSYALDEVILIGERGEQVSLSHDVPRAIRADVVAVALAAAVSKAETRIAQGGSYADPDDLHGIDATHLYGFKAGLTRARHTRLLDEVGRIEKVGMGLLVVRERDSEAVALCLGSRDMVLRELLERRDLF